MQTETTTVYRKAKSEQRIWTYWLRCLGLGVAFIAGGAMAGVEGPAGVFVQKAADLPQFAFGDESDQTGGNLTGCVTGVCSYGVFTYGGGTCSTEAREARTVLAGTSGLVSSFTFTSTSNADCDGDNWGIVQWNDPGKTIYAIKFSGGVVASDDSASLVLCAPTDTFTPAAGCVSASPPPVSAALNLSPLQSIAFVMLLAGVGFFFQRWRTASGSRQ